MNEKHKRMKCRQNGEWRNVCTCESHPGQLLVLYCVVDV